MRFARSFSMGALLAAGLAVPAEACTVSVTGVAFGNYSPLSGTPRDGVGTVTLRCHPNVQSPVIALDAGGSGTFAARRMTNGPKALSYNLYTTAARIIVWGNGSGGSATVTGSGGTVTAGTRTFNVPIYGRIPERQNDLTPGAYSDTLFATITF